MEPHDIRDRIARSQAGDRGAFADLIRAHVRLVWATVYGVFGDPAWAEDVVQETFMKAWKSIGALGNPESFPGWLTTMARRLAWDKAEELARKGQVSADPESAPGPKRAGSQDESREEAREKVQEAIGRLPEKYRLPVTLQLLDGMKYEAISGLLGMSNGSLRGLLVRGKKLLRAELAPWWRTNRDGA